MNDTLKRFLKNIVWIVITFLFLEALLLSAIQVIYTLSEYKLDISIDVVLQDLRYLFSHLSQVIQNYITERNPFFTLGTGAILIYAIFLNRKSNKKKSSWQTEEELGYHGTARWAKNSEVFDNQNFLSESKRTVQSKFMRSLKGHD